jgi:hypothetical protein
MDIEQIKQEDELREIIELSVKNALLSAIVGDLAPLEALWMTVLASKGSAVKTSGEQLEMALVRAYLR